MDVKLFFSRNPNPRLAVAVARFLDAKVEFEFASPFAPGQAERFRSLNVGRWYGQLDKIDAWRDPFRGLDAPALPEIAG